MATIKSPPVKTLWLVLAVGIAGCYSSKPLKTAPKQEPKPASSVRRVDPRSLEQTYKPASSAYEEHAKAHHKTTEVGERYPVFQKARLLTWGGFAAHFGTKANSEGVTYYFDALGPSDGNSSETSTLLKMMRPSQALPESREIES